VFLHIPTPPLQDLLRPALLCSQQQCLAGQLVLQGHLQYSVGAGKLLEVREQVEIAMCSALSSLTPQCSEPNYGTMLILFFSFRHLNLQELVGLIKLELFPQSTWQLYSSLH
jgi:hypothetical protein